MSYNQGYSQPQGNMLGAQLPYPTYQLVMQPIPVVRGNPPVLPNVQYMPQELQQYYPLIVTDCIDAIQSKCQVNSLRTFLFNQMCQNNYNNLEFTAFVEGVVRLTYMRLGQRMFQDVQQAISSCANFFAELNTAANVLKYNDLLQGLDQATVAGVREVLNNFNRVNQELQQYFSGGQQQTPQPNYPLQGGGGYSQQGGYPQGFPQQGWQNPNQGPQGGYPQHTPHLPSAMWRDESRNLQAAHMSHAPAVAASPFSGGSGYTPGTPGGNIPSSDPVAARYETSGRNRQATSSESVHVQNIQEARRQKENQILGNVPLMQSTRVTPVQVQTRENIAVKASESSIVWSPSVKFPVNIAYDPNTSELYYRIDADGNVEPLIKPKEKSEMDMAAHLTVPSYAKTGPVGTQALDSNVRVFETEKSLVEDAAAIKEVEPFQLNVSYEDQSFHVETSLKEMWFNNQVQLSIMKKKDKRTNLFRSCGVLMDPLVTTKNPKSMINDIASTTTLEAACNKMQSIRSQIDAGTYPHGDAKALTFINDRLTTRLNDFLKKQLAIPNGWVDSFMDDALHDIAFIDKKYGKAFASALIDKQSMIIKEALTYGESKFEGEQLTNLFPNQDYEKILEGVYVTYFYYIVTLTSMDLFSPELKMELPKSEVAVGIFEDQTPLLRKVAENILTHERALQLECTKHLIQTADGATLEIAQSVIHPGFYLVCDADL